ncbi:S41 family peptidase [Pedobacter caeni]|uniref:Peptidase family S41 n=1 Tax=Pedobacter caeni TaxID=288992 RepID=A0A1M5JPU5_9SPHI|nr:S41 family peptidase [Pedobacter caeni]SHG42596.1 Peptidase family S41 [Pedobacter caeni]
MRKLLTLLFCLVTCSLQSWSFENHKDSTLFDVSKLRADLTYLKVVLEKAHPSLYRYVSKDSLDQMFDQTSLKLNEPMDALKFWQLTQTIVAKIGCGHTTIIPALQARKGLWEDNYLLLPFYISIQDNRLFIQRYIQSPGKSDYRIKDEILSVNGQDTRLILAQMRSLVSSDGYSNAYRDYKLEMGSFNLNYAGLNKNTSDFKVVLRRKGATWTTTISSRVTTKTYKEIEQNEDRDLIGVSYPTDMNSVAILRIKGFRYGNFLQKNEMIFRELEAKKIETLILDLRNNPGGRSDIAIDLMKYLVGKKFRFIKNTDGVVDFGRFSALFKGNRRPDLSLLEQLPHRPFQRTYDSDKRQDIHKIQFKGKLFLLINEGTYSTSALLASALRSQTDCLLVGTETGGGALGCNGGAVVNVPLPATGQELVLPLMWTYAIGSRPSKPGTGVLPDYEVDWGALMVDSQSQAKSDPLLLKIKGLIN